MRGPQRICRDHPRSRGVYMSSIMKTAGRAGSSPLARGLLGKLVPVLSGERIIPARAGFTVVRFWTWSFRPDHPRSRGVYHRRRELTTAILGSSPLARGLPPGPVSRPYGFGIIPARAGFTLFSGPAYAPHGDHPRSRGVYLAKSSYTMNAVGSSPLARGLLGSRGPVEHVQRIIPARAGFTSGPRFEAVRLRDHPRSRGVYASDHLGHGAERGSSPLARGLRTRVRRRRKGSGIIPARAGFTGRRWVTSLMVPDHPRSRGVYSSARVRMRS